MTIGKDFEKYFKEGQEKYLNIKAKNKTPTAIEIRDEPEWWQDDQTPLNSKGQKMKFICHLQEQLADYPISQPYPNFAGENQ